MKIQIQNKYFRYGAYSTLFIAVILGGLIVVNYLSTLAFSRFDMTEGKEYSISPATQGTLKNLDDIVNVKAFFSKNLPSQMVPVTSRIRDMLDEYRAYSKGKVRVQYLDPGDDPKIEEEAKSLGLQPVRMDAIEKDQRQIVTGYMGIVIQYLDKKELLPLVTDVEDLEYNLTRAVKKLVRNEDLKIGTLSGFSTMPLDSQAAMLNDELKKQYTVQPVDVGDGNPIDSTLKALLVIGPENITDRAKFEIDQYLMKGGKVIFLVDGVSVKTEYGLQGAPRNHNLNDLLGSYGARIGGNLVLDRACAMAQFQTRMAMGFMSYFQTPYPFWPKLAEQYINRENPVINRLAGAVLPWCSSVEILIDSADTAKGVRPLILAQSTKYSWTMEGSYNLDPQSQVESPQARKMPHNLMVVLQGRFHSFYNGKAIPKFKKKVTLPDGSTRETDTVHVQDPSRIILTQSPETRILLVGNSQFMTDQFIQQTQGINGNLLLNMVDWMAQDDNLITIRSRKVIDRPLKTITPAQRSLVKWANVIIMPVLVIVFGLTRMVIRKRRQNKAKEAA